MAETQTDLSASVTFSDPQAAEFAQGLHATLQSAGINATAPELKPPEDAVLGVGEVLIALSIASVGRAVVLAALDPLEKYLEKKIADRSNTRIQIVLVGADELPKRFPLGLRGTTTDVLHTFISKLRIALESV